MDIRKFTSSLLFILSSSGILFAGGFQLNVQGFAGLGMGGAATAMAQDASVVFFNPGGMSFLENKYTFTGGVTAVIPYVAVQTTSTPNTFGTSPIATPIQFYFSTKLTDRISLGFGVNNQFGSTASYDNNWEGKYIIQNEALQTFMFQPTISYKICDRLAIGAGFVYTMGSFSYQKAVPVSTAEYDCGEASLSGSGVGFSYNAGIQAILIKADNTRRFGGLKAGLSYRSPISLSINNGNAAFSDISTALQGEFPAQTTFSTQMTLPAVLSAGLQSNYAINDKVNIDFVLDYVRTFWSSYNTLTINFANPTTPQSVSVKNYQDVNAVKLGISINYNSRYSLRLGTYYDQTPIPNGYLSPELPDNTNVGFTAGLGFKATKKLSIDVSWLVFDVYRTGSLDQAGFNATYNFNVNVIGAGLTYKFN